MEVSSRKEPWPPSLYEDSSFTTAHFLFKFYLASWLMARRPVEKHSLALYRFSAMLRKLAGLLISIHDPSARGSRQHFRLRRHRPRQIGKSINLVGRGS